MDGWVLTEILVKRGFVLYTMHEKRETKGTRRDSFWDKSDALDDTWMGSQIPV